MLIWNSLKKFFLYALQKVISKNVPEIYTFFTFTHVCQTLVILALCKNFEGKPAKTAQRSKNVFSKCV